MAKISATAVSAFSPPESRLHALQLLARRLRDDLHARLLRPARSWVSSRLARPPPNSRGKICLELLVDHVEGLLEALRGWSCRSSRSRASSCCERRPRGPSSALERKLVALDELGVLLDGGEVDLAHALDLGAQLLEPLLRLGGRAAAAGGTGAPPRRCRDLVALPDLRRPGAPARARARAPSATHLREAAGCSSLQRAACSARTALLLGAQRTSAAAACAAPGAPAARPEPGPAPAPRARSPGRGSARRASSSAVRAAALGQPPARSAPAAARPRRAGASAAPAARRHRLRRARAWRRREPSPRSAARRSAWARGLSAC